jgi:hypothetical protein
MNPFHTLLWLGKTRQRNKIKKKDIEIHETLKIDNIVEQSTRDY